MLVLFIYNIYEISLFLKKMQYFHAKLTPQPVDPLIFSRYEDNII